MQEPVLAAFHSSVRPWGQDIICSFISKSQSLEQDLEGLNKYPLNELVEVSKPFSSVQFISVQSLSCVQFFVTPWTAARQTSLSITNSRSPLKLMCIESVMPSNHLILCRPLLLQPSIFPRIRVFSNESVLCLRWPKDWSFSFSISPSNEYSGLISFRIYWFDLLAVQELSRVFSNTTVQKQLGGDK